jgi:hypothetical protein
MTEPQLPPKPPKPLEPHQKFEIEVQGLYAKADPAIQAIFTRAKQEMRDMADHYQMPWERLEDRHFEKLSRVLEAKSSKEADEQRGRAVFAVQMVSLACRQKGLIPGPKTVENFQKKAKGAESLAKLKEKQGNDKAAAKQRERAETLWAQAEELKRQAAAPKPDTAQAPPTLEAAPTTRKHPKHPKAKKVRHDKAAELRKERRTRRVAPGIAGPRRGLFRIFGL